MSTESAYKLLKGHGVVKCRSCGEIIVQCRCPFHKDQPLFDLCNDCEETCQSCFYNTFYTEKDRKICEDCSNGSEFVSDVQRG